jgi:WXG100 family type VII secretion target
MANSFFQLNYDQLTSISKSFKDEGEDMVRLHSATRQRVRDLHTEWIGEAAEKFFEEMETELLPAVQRLAQALFLSQDVTGDIMKIVQDADEETAGYFRNQLSGDDFGAGLFGRALDGLQGGQSAADDFGAGKFGEALGSSPTGGDGSSASDDFGAAKFGEAVDHSASGQGDSGTPGEDGSTQGSDRESQKSAKEQQTETEPSPTGGSGGGSSSSSSQGLQGDLKNMGVGSSNQAPQTASAGGEASPGTPDHIYSDSGSPKPDEAPIPKGDESKPGVNTGSSESGQSSSVGGTGAAAGAAGAAAAGGAAKAVKGKAKKNAE